MSISAADEYLSQTYKSQNGIQPKAEWTGGLNLMYLRITSSIYVKNKHNQDFLGVPVVKNLPANAGDMGSIPGPGTKIPTCHGATKPMRHDY